MELNPTPQKTVYKELSDVAFFVIFGCIGLFYILMIVALILADLQYPALSDFTRVFQSPEIRYATKLSLVSCSITAILSLWVAVPIGYLMSRFHFPLKKVVDAILDIPIILPPLVIGLSLLIFFKTPLGKAIESVVPVTFSVVGVVIAQFTVACAFAVRIMRGVFDQISPRLEQVALTLGCTRSQAFWGVVFPECKRGLITAGTIAWARALGEFGPILLFSGATRMKTEVLSTTVFLEMSVGSVEGAVCVSLLMVGVAILVLILVRQFGYRGVNDVER